MVLLLPRRPCFFPCSFFNAHRFESKSPWQERSWRAESLAEPLWIYTGGARQDQGSPGASGVSSILGWWQNRSDLFRICLLRSDRLGGRMGFSWHGEPGAVGLPAGMERSHSEPLAPALGSGALGTKAGMQKPGTSKPHRGHFRPQLGHRFDLNMRKNRATKTQPAHPPEEPLPVPFRASLGTGLIPVRYPSFILLVEPVRVVARVPTGPHAVPRMWLRLAEGRKERSQDAVCNRGLRHATLVIPWQEMLIA